MRRRTLLLALVILLGAMAAAHVALRNNRDQVLAYARNIVLYDPAELTFGLVEGTEMEFPTSIQVGRDGRLYLADERGLLYAYTLSRTASGTIEARDGEVIDVVQQIPNHGDDGTVAPNVEGRLVTGLLAAGSSEAPSLYVSSSDPRTYSKSADTNSGMISIVERSGDSWTRRDLVCGLPRSRTDHATNGLWLDPERRYLYVIQGANTNAGAPWERSGNLAEYALSSALLRVDLKGLPESCWDLPTLDDPARPGNPDTNDPWGGASGNNQAVLDSSGPLTLFATGFRNAFRIVPFQDGFLTIDNGMNQDYGGPPLWRAGHITNLPAEEPGIFDNGVFLRVREGSYHGHPNPTRADRHNLFAGQSPIDHERPQEAHFAAPRDRDGALALVRRSVNGLVWYPEDAGPDSWQGKLVVVGWDRVLRLLEIDEGGAIVEARSLIHQLASTPLDIAVSPSGSEFSGVVWVSDYASGRVIAVEPVPSGRLQAWKRTALMSLRSAVFAYYQEPERGPLMELLTHR